MGLFKRTTTPKSVDKPAPVPVSPPPRTFAAASVTGSTMSGDVSSGGRMASSNYNVPHGYGKPGPARVASPQYAPRYPASPPSQQLPRPPVAGAPAYPQPPGAYPQPYSGGSPPSARVNPPPPTVAQPPPTPSTPRTNGPPARGVSGGNANHLAPPSPNASPPPQRPLVPADDMRQRLENVLGDKSNFIKSARGSFNQFDFDGSGTLSFAECRALIDRLIVNLTLPPIDDQSLLAIYHRFNSNEGGEMGAEDFSMMFWQILWRVKEKYYPAKNVCVRRSFFVNRTAISQDEIKKLFEFKKRLGGGSFGEAHLVVERTSGLERCCKTINKDKAAVPIGQINAEVTVLKTLDHPNVIKILEVYEDYNNLYIIQDLCEGGELFTRIKQASERGKILTEKYVKEVMWQLLEALSYIHDKHVVHKDLKPENIMYQTDEVHSPIKIIDFGLAEIFQRQEDVSAVAAGTALYFAPEVYSYRVSMKSDLWSTGVIMYQMLTGRTPFTGRTREELRARITRCEPSYDTHCRHVSPEALNLLKCLLRKNPSQRLSAKQALQHSWFQSEIANSVVLDADLKHNLAQYARHSNLKAALMNMLTHQLNFNSKQIRRLSEIFKRMDKDHSGTLSREELAAGLSKAGLAPWEINKIVQALDVDGSGDISYTEFLAAAYTWREAELNIIWTAFSKLDHDKNGKISVSEFAEMLQQGKAGSKLLDNDSSSAGGNDQLMQMIQALDSNNDGYIEWLEFLNYMRDGTPTAPTTTTTPRA